MKKIVIISSIVLIILIIFVVPKPYSLSTEAKSCKRVFFNDGIETLIPNSVVYESADSGWCVGMIYPTSKEKEIGNPSCTMLTKGWDCLGYKFLQEKGPIAL